MSMKKTVSLLLSLIMVLTVFAAAPFTVASADSVKRTITFSEEGYHAFVVLYGGETERVTEAAAGTEIHISRHGDAVIEDGYYFTGAYYVNGVLNYGASFNMPDCDVTVAPHIIKQTAQNLDLTYGERVHCSPVLRDELLYKLSLNKVHDDEEECWLIDLDNSGVYDVKLFDAYYEPSNPVGGASYYPMQRCDSADAVGKFSYALPYSYSQYNPITLILSYDGYPRFSINKPDYILISGTDTWGRPNDIDLAEPGETISVYVSLTEANIGSDNYLTGEILVDGVSLGTDESGEFISSFVMPDHDVTVTAATAKKKPFFQNLSDGKAHQISSEFDTFFRYDEPVEWRGHESSYYLDINNTRTYDVHCFTEYTYDDNGDIVDRRFYVQLLDDADFTNVFTIDRTSNISEYSSVNFVNVLCGDTDGNGNVSIMDATGIQFYLVDLPIDFHEYEADADCNNEVDIIDATVIQRRLAGYDI